MKINVLSTHRWIITVSNSVSLSSGESGGLESMGVGWGQAGGSFSVSLQTTSDTAGPTNTYLVEIDTPWGSWSSGTVSGTFISSGYVLATMSGGELAVDGECNATLSFTSLVFQLSIDGGSASTVLSIGAESVSFSGYDARLNTDTFSVSVSPSLIDPPIWDSSTCSPDNLPVVVSQAGTAGIGSAAGPDGVAESGYSWGSPGAWSTYPITVDTTAAPPCAACSSSLPTVSGSDSGHIVLTSTYSNVITATAEVYECPCGDPGGHTAAYNYTHWDQTFFNESSSLFLIPSSFPVGGVQTQVYDDCNGTATTTTSTSAATPTKCGGTRSTSYVQQSLNCLGSAISSCPVPYNPTCPPPTALYCKYVGSSTVSWPNLPPCGPSEPRAYDVSNAVRHCVVYGIGSGNQLILGCAGNELPQTFTYVNTGLTGTWARIRFQDHGATWPVGIFYGDGSNCFFAQSFDEGSTWSTAVSMASGSIGDFEEDAAGRRWLYKLVTPDGGTTWDVWNRLMDSQLNVVRDWTITNVTGVDNSPIAVRSSPDSTGAWRIGLYYSLSGIDTLMFSYDGLYFS